jgi:hypothetical protein
MLRTHDFRFHSQRGKSSRREGAVLVAALVCLLVVMTMLGAMLLSALRAHRELHRERDLRQTELLLQAGSDRAVARFANDPTYRGETWELPAASIADKGNGRVTIKISSEADQNGKTANVVAEYPVGDEWSIRRSRTIHIQPQPPRQ